ncbi:MAG: tetratricopeptide repeat protein [Verrucomicrobia bacterium]|nr:tetratricopeptide repeat protein [Verrucomicrobiota bacterium]
MKKAVSLVCFLLCFAVHPVSGLSHASQPHSVRGIVITIDGTVVPEFSVVVRHVSDKPELAERKHFKNGEFTIDGLKGEKYQLQIASPSYIPARIDFDFKSKTDLSEHRIVILHTFRNERRLAPGAADIVTVRKLQEKIPDAARDCYQKAVELHRDGKLDEALIEYGKAIRAYPNYAEALSDLATIFLLYNRPEAAMTFLHRAQDIDDSNPVINLNVAIALTEQSDYSGAMKLLKKILHDNPKTALAYLYMGRIHFIQKKYGEAQEYAMKAVDLDPQLLDAWLLIVNAASEQKKFDEARQALTHIRQTINNGKVVTFIDEQLSMLGS